MLPHVDRCRTRFARHVAILVACACIAALATAPARAEKADRTKPINVESDRMNVDDVKKVSVFEGKVIITQGTLSIHADKVTMRQDRDGYQYGTAIGHPATFRQKRDGADEYVQGEAERIEYDGKLDRVELFDNARLLRDPADEVRGNYISYDSRTEYFTVSGSPGTGPQGRVHAVIQPRDTSADAGNRAAPDAPKR